MNGNDSCCIFLRTESGYEEVDCWEILKICKSKYVVDCMGAHSRVKDKEIKTK